MLHIKTKLKDIKAKNLLYFMKNIEDIENIHIFGELSETIVEHIKKSFESGKSSFQEYFLSTSKFEKLYIIISQESCYKQEILFLGKHLLSLPENFCLCALDPKDTISLLETCLLARYSFQEYKSVKKQEYREIFCLSEQKKTIEDTLERIKNIYLARDLGETPACDLTPEIFAQKIKKTKFERTKVKILSYKDIQKKGFGLLEGVGKGSENKPCIVILEHIVDKKKPILGIVGKGVTFDTGGNQIKPGDHMYDMKGDMGGAAVTLALMKELDRKKSKKNIVACLVLAENVVSHNSYKPSDILKAYNGKTVEVIHTDAEGRLILADGISYLGKHYKTSQMMTIATLTGACIVALGYRYAGIMGNHEELIEKILEYSRDHTEQYVRLPFDEYFIEKTKSQIADYKNLDRSVMAGSSMGAAFLSNFLENNEKYVHIDIAGVYINSADAYGKMPKGITGFGVESLSTILGE